MASHRYRRDGVKYVQPIHNKSGTRWTAQGYEPDGKTCGLGTFDTALRAQMAVRLFKFWLAKGFAASAIPRMPRTKDAI